MNWLISNLPLAVAVQLPVIIPPEGIDIVNVAVDPLMVPETVIGP